MEERSDKGVGGRREVGGTGDGGAVRAIHPSPRGGVEGESRWEEGGVNGGAGGGDGEEGNWMGGLREEGGAGGGVGHGGGVGEGRRGRELRGGRFVRGVMVEEP